jgi:twinkle protein
MHERAGSSFVRKEPCPSCGSRDNLARYSDGHAYCFGCGRYEKGDDVQTTDDLEEQAPDSSWAKLFGSVVPIESRCLRADTCEKWGYEVGEDEKGKLHIANHYNRHGQLIGQKIRKAGKQFSVRGVLAPLYGMWLWQPGGKMLVVTEGEIDALSVSQAQGNKWPVCSIPNGAQGAAKCFQNALEYLESFEKVVLMFDMDEPGQKAAEACAQLLTPGRAYIARLPLKDANDMLRANRERELIDAIWRAAPYRPDGIVAGTTTEDIVFTEVSRASVPYPYPALQRITHGLRQGELVTVTAGTGIGKSTMCRELAHHLLMTHGATVGIVALEESVRRTMLGLMSIEANRPLHLLSNEELQEHRGSWERVAGSGRLYLYDHFGSMASDRLINKVRYMIKGCGVQFVVLDHLSIVVSGQETADERKAIDVTMTNLRSLVEETGAGMLLVSHLRRGEGKAHEEGGQVRLSDLRGSHSIAQLSDLVIALERNQQAEGAESSLLQVRVLKNRFTGETGTADTLLYNRETGRIEVAGEFKPGGPDAASDF